VSAIKIGDKVICFLGFHPTVFIVGRIHPKTIQSWDEKNERLGGYYYSKYEIRKYDAEKMEQIKELNTKISKLKTERYDLFNNFERVDNAEE